ncbi:hypothetical protein [Cohnella nanjingensis]|uniref:hypothetical protein n=1 Tax=Cohnella nanjingensis TaxID=1387779 RepID=UPI001C8747E0|nr:hypothetical protein [Cohnella nanjingensis]
MRFGVWLAALLLFAVPGWPTTTVRAANTTYYVDPAGSDDNDGLSPGTAWKSLVKVNGTTFGPGDNILFKAGGSWSGQLWPKGSGSAASPIVIDRYGTGSAPVIAGDKSVVSNKAALYLNNQSYWHVQNLKLTFPAADNNNLPRSGVYIHASAAGTYRGLHLSNLEIADVKSISCWECTDDAGQPAGRVQQRGHLRVHRRGPQQLPRLPEPGHRGEFRRLAHSEQLHPRLDRRRHPFDEQFRSDHRGPRA